MLLLCNFFFRWCCYFPLLLSRPDPALDLCDIWVVFLFIYLLICGFLFILSFFGLLLSFSSCAVNISILPAIVVSLFGSFYSTRFLVDSSELNSKSFLRRMRRVEHFVVHRFFSFSLVFVVVYVCVSVYICKSGVFKIKRNNHCFIRFFRLFFLSARMVCMCIAEFQSQIQPNSIEFEVESNSMQIDELRICWHLLLSVGYCHSFDGLIFLWKICQRIHNSWNLILNYS